MINVVLNSRFGSHMATGVYSNNTVTVKKGSKICSVDLYSGLSAAVKTVRHDSSIVGDDGIVKKDISFNSPTAAAHFVTGRSINGYIAWRPENKMSLKEYLQNEKQQKNED